MEEIDHTSDTVRLLLKSAGATQQKKANDNKKVMKKEVEEVVYVR